MNVIGGTGARGKNSWRLGERLRRRIHQRWQTVTSEFRFGPAVLQFTRIADPNRVLDDAVAEEDRRRRDGDPPLYEPPHLPYWAELWDSAGGLAQVLARTEPLAGTRVLDLGCGMGLCGAVAAALRANVLLVDLEPFALLFARLNTLPFADRARVRRLDWRHDRLDEQFDLILGADILYERGQWEFLCEFFRGHLADHGRVLLAEPGRQSGDAFVPWIKQRDWAVREEIQPVVTRAAPIRILQLDRGVSAAGMAGG
jgi:predicted nicotinamide N-methyase